MSESSASKPPKIKNYAMGRFLGEGAFSKVYEATNRDTQEKYAIKIFPKSNLKDQNDVDHFQREVDAMAYLRYDNLVAMHDFFWDETNFYLVIDYCPGGDLFSYIIEHEKLNEPIAALLFKQIIGAIAYCHSFGVAHRDLKPENILITNFPNLKLTDFGLCGYISQQKLMQTFCGSPCYCAPECLCRVQYDGRLSDVWSLGVLLFAMVTGEHPWTVSNTSLMLRQIMKANYSIPEYVSQECQDLINSLLKVKPSARLSIEKIIQHPWLKFSEWALIKGPPDLDLALASMRMQQPLTLEQISSSSSRSSHMSDNGIINPFDDDYQHEFSDDETQPISLHSFMSLPKLGQLNLSSSFERLPTYDDNSGRRRYCPMSASTKYRKALCIPKPKPNLMMAIKEVE